MEKTGALPKCITASFAFYLAFYHGRNLTEDGLVAARPAGDEYTVKDDKPVLQFFYDHKDDDTASFVHAVCTNDDFWDEDLSKIPGFEEAVAGYLRAIKEKGTYEVMKECSH